MDNLVDAVKKQLEQWIFSGSQWPKNIWVKGKEGEIYIRYNPVYNYIDLATFRIKKKCQGKGISKRIIEEALTFPVNHVRIENIFHAKWGAAVKRYLFPGFTTKVLPCDGRSENDLGYSIDFVRKEQ